MKETSWSSGPDTHLWFFNLVFDLTPSQAPSSLSMLLFDHTVRATPSAERLFARPIEDCAYHLIKFCPSYATTCQGSSSSSEYYGCVRVLRRRGQSSHRPSSTSSNSYSRCAFLLAFGLRATSYLPYRGSSSTAVSKPGASFLVLSMSATPIMTDHGMVSRGST